MAGAGPAGPLAVSRAAGAPGRAGPRRPSSTPCSTKSGPTGRSTCAPVLNKAPLAADPEGHDLERPESDRHLPARRGVGRSVLRSLLQEVAPRGPRRAVERQDRLGRAPLDLVAAHHAALPVIDWLEAGDHHVGRDDVEPARG